jgi:Protein kinase domain
MGAVYLAERSDGEIQRKVAVKLLRADAHRAAWRDRFLRERQLLASLNHPSIVRMIDAGHTDGGQPYLVMEYVEGTPIDVYAAGIEVRERLMLFLRVCDAVSHAPDIAPRFYEYIASLAPPEQVGTFMGFAFLPVSIASFVAEPLAGWLVASYVRGGHPNTMWYVLSGIGLASTAAI